MLLWNSSLPTEKITPWFLRFCSSDLNWGEIKPCWSWRVCGLRYISPELAWTLGDEEAPALLSHEFANVQWTSLNKQGHILCKDENYIFQPLLSINYPQWLIAWWRNDQLYTFVCRIGIDCSHRSRKRNAVRCSCRVIKQVQCRKGAVFLNQEKTMN